MRKLARDEFAITIEYPGLSNAAAIEADCRSAMIAALDKATEAPRPALISLTIADDVFVQALNRDWRGEDKPTNILAFAHQSLPFPPGDGQYPTPLGDLVLSWPTVSREAAIIDKSTMAHLQHLIVHGTLHLLGYDHMNNIDATRMEMLETDILSGLGVADPYAEDLPQTIAAG